MRNKIIEATIDKVVDESNYPSDFKKAFIIRVTVLLSVMCMLLLVALSFIPLSLFFSSL